MENVERGFMPGDAVRETESSIETKKDIMPEEIIETAAKSSLDEYANGIYVTPEVAKEEIWKRWNNADLKREVEEFLGNDIPDFLKDAPKSVLARNIASPNREAMNFLKISKDLGLQPSFVEYLSDKFVSVNFDKRHLSKIFFYNGKGRSGGDKVSASEIVDMPKADGHKIYDVKTKWDEGFTEFHHRLFSEVLPQENISIFDASSWLARHGGDAQRYYEHYLALFLCHGVLAEMFLLYTEEDKAFFENIVMPAIQALEKRFGVLPLIVQIAPPETSADLSWKYYPEFMKTMIPCEYARHTS